MDITNDFSSRQAVVFSQRLAWGLSLMAGSLLITLISNIYAFTQLGVVVDPLAMQNAQVNPLQIVLSCIAPIGLLLNLVGIIFIFSDSSRLGGAHRKAAIIALLIYVASLLLAGVTIFLSITATMQGSLSNLLLASWLGAFGGIAGYVALFLLTVNLAPLWVKLAIGGGALLQIAVTLATTIMTVSTTTLQSYEVMGNTMYIPKIGLDMTTGLFAALTGVGMFGVVIILVGMIALAILAWRSASQTVSDVVA